MGDIKTLTVAEYRATAVAGVGFAYRLYRHPLVMFGLGPDLAFRPRSNGCRSA